MIMVVSELLDAFHVLAMVTMVTIPLFAPIKFVPAWLCFQIYFATRYHDYCVLTKTTEIAGKFWNGCDPGEKDFTIETQDFYKKKLGIEVPHMLIRNLCTALVGVSMVVSIFRLSKAYKFDFFPKDKNLFRITLAISLLFILMEINIDLLWDSDFPRCEDCEFEWTTLEQIEETIKKSEVSENGKS